MSKTPKKYLIIGNSAAAVGCIEAIRALDTAGSIVLISDEPHHTYARPLISYLLYGKTTEERMKYRPDDFYTKNNVYTMLNTAVTAIDAEKHEVLAGTARIKYDKLLVATGSAPFVPPIEGLDTVKSKFTFMTLNDAKALDAAVTKTTRVLIMGAGLIGLKCAEGLSKKTDAITVVDLAPQILPSILDAAGAALVADRIAAHGIKLITGAGAKSFTAHSATLSTGQVVDFDVLVVAVGVRPNTRLVKEAGGDVGRGIVTNQNCQTSLPDVYAAGDCAESTDVVTGQAKVLALLPNAYMQGECAGVHMTGAAKPYDKALAMNAIGFFGNHVITAGVYEGAVYEEIADGTYKKLFYKDDRLMGFILIDRVECAGIYTSLLRDKTPLSSIDFASVCANPRLIAFSKAVRREKLKV